MVPCAVISFFLVAIFVDRGRLTTGDAVANKKAREESKAWLEARQARHAKKGVFHHGHDDEGPKDPQDRKLTQVVEAHEGSPSESREMVAEAEQAAKGLAEAGGLDGDAIQR